MELVMKNKLSARIQDRREWLVRLNKEIKYSFDQEQFYQSRKFLKHRLQLLKVINQAFTKIKKISKKLRKDPYIKTWMLGAEIISRTGKYTLDNGEIIQPYKLYMVVEKRKKFEERIK